MPKEGERVLRKLGEKDDFDARLSSHGLPKQSPTLVLTVPQAAQLRSSDGIRCFRLSLDDSKCQVLTGFKYCFPTPKLHEARLYNTKSINNHISTHFSCYKYNIFIVSCKQIQTGSSKAQCFPEHLSENQKSHYHTTAWAIAVQNNVMGQNFFKLSGEQSEYGVIIQIIRQNAIWISNPHKIFKRMCGIWAIVNRALQANQQISSFEKVQPRGPDHSVLHLSKSCMIGFHRLAINELTYKGEQPFYHHQDDYRLTVIANGEIYNHHDIRKKFNFDIESKNDCIVILHLFLALKGDFQALNRELVGEYAIFIVKQNLKTGVVDYYLSTDPLSVRPVFYFSTEQQFGCSSLLCGISDFSQNVERLNQGHLLQGRFDPSTSKNETLLYKKYTVQPQVIYIEENIELYREIVNNLKQCVRDRLMSERPIGCLLSGGLDSSLVASIAASILKEQGKKLRTFSIGMDNATDIGFARDVAKHIGSDHTEFLYEPEEGLELINDVVKTVETFDITTIRSSIPLYILAKKIAQETDITVLLNGDGADECQMGYLYFYLAPTAEEAKNDRDRLLREIHLYDGVRVDRNVSHFGLESRLPYLDERFVNLYYKISPDIIRPTRERMEKYLIRRAFEVVWPEVLPKSVLWRVKQAFSDGVSSVEKSWYVMVKQKIENQLFPQLVNEDKPITHIQQQYKFEGLQPVCAESQYYRLLHHQTFNANHSMAKHYWLPSWAGTNEPSARILSVYSTSEQ